MIYQTIESKIYNFLLLWHRYAIRILITTHTHTLKYPKNYSGFSFTLFFVVVHSDVFFYVLYCFRLFARIKFSFVNCKSTRNLCKKTKAHTHKEKAEENMKKPKEQKLYQINSLIHILSKSSTSSINKRKKIIIKVLKRTENPIKATKKKQHNTKHNNVYMTDI